MLPTDTFERAYASAVAGLQAWLVQTATDAAIDEEQAAGYWRIRVEPFARNACPVELVLRRDQRFDLTIGPETYEDQPITDLAWFIRLLEAIAAGQVVTRTWMSVATGAVCEVETIVTLADATVWSKSRDTPFAGAAPPEARERQDRVYVPYRRATAR